MNPETFDHIFRCPKCKSKLLWKKRRCSVCDADFQMEQGILNFIDQYTALSDQHQAEIKLHYSLAKEYENRYQTEFSKIYSNYWNEQFLSHLPESAKMILDCGCGTGDLTQALQAPGKQIIGMDISKAMIQQARTLIKDWENIIWAVGPAESLPFADEILDAVCFRGALHHIADESLALKEAHRVLKPGGMLLLSEPNDDSLLLRLPRKLVNQHLSRFGNNHKAFRTQPWIKTIQEMGFFIRDTKYFSFLSQPLCGMSDLLPLMNILPYSKPIAYGLVRFDEICARLPCIQRQSFDFFIAAEKITN